MLTGLKEKYTRLIKVLADGGYQGKLQTWFFRHTKGCMLAVVKPDKGTKGFQILQWRWVIERSFAWLGNFRRLSKDYEMTTSSAKAFIALAFSRIMLKNYRGLRDWFLISILNLLYTKCQIKSRVLHLSLNNPYPTLILLSHPISITFTVFMTPSDIKTKGEGLKVS